MIHEVKPLRITFTCFLSCLYSILSFSLLLGFGSMQELWESGFGFGLCAPSKKSDIEEREYDQGWSSFVRFKWSSNTARFVVSCQLLQGFKSVICIAMGVMGYGAIGNSMEVSQPGRVFLVPNLLVKQFLEKWRSQGHYALMAFVFFFLCSVSWWVFPAYTWCFG